jgi:pyruvate,water dikinase
MLFVKTLNQITKNHVDEAGGKGASLGEMLKAGIPVPPGFVVLSSAFEWFLKETNLVSEVEARLAAVKFKDINSVDRASNEIRSVIEKAKIPKDLETDILSHYKKLRAPLVAVRSSATAEDSKTASWAGELETYLNTDSKRLLDNIKKCWSSLYTTRAIYYRREKQLLKSRVSIAVVVQKMVQSEISGICFTVHPVTEDPAQLLIEAGYGLGEAIVSGAITPDSYVVDKVRHALIDVNVANQPRMLVKAFRGNKWATVKKSRAGAQKLSGRQILELAEMCKRVEKHYGFPCDIEWAFVKGQFYITQSRPITTLNKKP